MHDKRASFLSHGSVEGNASLSERDADGRAGMPIKALPTKGKEIFYKGTRERVHRRKPAGKCVNKESFQS